MLQQTRQHIIQSLWQRYRAASPQVQLIEKKLREKGIEKLPLDHFAIIDLPSEKSGIPHLSALFESLGYEIKGSDYLPSKQNGFAWLAEIDCAKAAAHSVLPQVVVADFRLDEMPTAIQHIIEKYVSKTSLSPYEALQPLIKRVLKNDEEAIQPLTQCLLNYLAGRDWPLPTVKEFYTVHEFNELLAWVLVFGRRPNHFTLSVHLLNQFSDLNDFHGFIQQEVKLELNQDGGIIKGGKASGIAQGSTQGTAQTIALLDGPVSIPTDFVEFVWRYPSKEGVQHHTAAWEDFFTGFIAQHANHVIESLYV